MYIKPVENRFPTESKKIQKKKNSNGEEHSFAESLESIVGVDAVEVTYSKDDEEKSKSKQQADENSNQQQQQDLSDGLNITV